jgi:hypothetical protein
MRLLNAERQPPSGPPATEHITPVGLDGFASEDEKANALAVAQSTSSTSKGPRIVIASLALLVLLEAVPAALWVRDYLTPASPPPVAALPSEPAAAPGATLAAAAPCEVAANPATAIDATTAAAAKTPPPSAVASAAGAAPIAAGLLAFAAPVPMQVFERGRLIGTTESETLMLAVGAHDLEFVNDAVGYRSRRTVTVQPGRTTTTRLETPPGALNINAAPWAEVWIDNQRMGETPLANVKVPIGTREVVFRHPEFGERRTRVLVTLKEVTRLSMDLRKQ